MAGTTGLVDRISTAGPSFSMTRRKLLMVAGGIAAGAATGLAACATVMREMISRIARKGNERERAKHDSKATRSWNPRAGEVESAASRREPFTRKSLISNDITEECGTKAPEIRRRPEIRTRQSQRRRPSYCSR